MCGWRIIEETLTPELIYVYLRRTQNSGISGITFNIDVALLTGSFLLTEFLPLSDIIHYHTVFFF